MSGINGTTRKEIEMTSKQKVYMIRMAEKRWRAVRFIRRSLTSDNPQKKVLDEEFALLEEIIEELSGGKKKK